MCPLTLGMCPDLDPSPFPDPDLPGSGFTYNKINNYILILYDTRSVFWILDPVSARSWNWRCIRNRIRV
jgi:hypothetical protein